MLQKGGVSWMLVRALLFRHHAHGDAPAAWRLGASAPCPAVAPPDPESQGRRKYAETCQPVAQCAGRDSERVFWVRGANRQQNGTYGCACEQPFVESLSHLGPPWLWVEMGWRGARTIPGPAPSEARCGSLAVGEEEMEMCRVIASCGELYCVAVNLR